MKKLICIALTALLALCFVLSGCKQGTVVSKTDGSAFVMGKPDANGKTPQEVVNDVYENYAKNYYQTH